MANFALIGVAGFVAPRHLEAIFNSGHEVVVAHDLHDSVGVLDSYFPNARFIVSPDSFTAYMKGNLRRSGSNRIDYVSICSPTNMHAEHIGIALRAGADAICEKPLVLTEKEVDAVQRLEQQTGRRVLTVLQLRYHPGLVSFRHRLSVEQPKTPFDVSLEYVAPRGVWYDVSWKGDEEKSGGLLLNIGVNKLDILIMMF